MCTIMREDERAFADTIYHYKVQFLRYTFKTHFGMGTRPFQKLVLKMKLLLSL